MSAEVVDIHDYLSICPPERQEKPAAVVFMPHLHMEREMMRKYFRAKRALGRDDSLPSDCEP